MANLIIGTDNGETINGTGRSDVVFGCGGNDILNGFAGSDQLAGGANDDTLNGGLGGDALVGATRTDAASYATAAADVHTDLDAPTVNTGEAADDTYRLLATARGRHGRPSPECTTTSTAASGRKQTRYAAGRATSWATPATFGPPGHLRGK